MTLALGIEGGDDDPGDAGCDQRVGAGRRAAVVAARLEADVGRGAGGIAGRLCSAATSAWSPPRSDVPALAQHPPVAHDDAAHHRVWRCSRAAALRQLERPGQVAGVDGVDVAAGHCQATTPAASAVSTSCR